MSTDKYSFHQSLLKSLFAVQLFFLAIFPLIVYIGPEV